jgi:hypothetical protein
MKSHECANESYLAILDLDGFHHAMTYWKDPS